jgi:hypothetical protein
VRLLTRRGQLARRVPAAAVGDRHRADRYAPVLAGFPAPVVALGTHGGKIYAGA